MKNFLFKVSMVYLLMGQIFVTFAGITSGEVNVTTGSYTANDHIRGTRRIALFCTDMLSGFGVLESPTISIRAKKFNFTGTIKCGSSCEIITQEPFDHAMFKREGNGSFRFEIKQMPAPVQQDSDAKGVSPKTISAEGIDFTLRTAAEMAMADAMKNDDIKKANELIDATESLQKNENTLTTLMILAGALHATKITDRLIEQGASMNGIGITDDSALLWAVGINNVPFINLLIKHGAQLNKKNFFSKGGITPLMLAASRGYLGAVKALVRAGADLSLKSDHHSSTALEYARNNNHAGVVRILENPECANESDGWTKFRKFMGF